MGAEGASDGVAEPVARANRRVEPARGGQVNVALQVGRAGTVGQAPERDILLNRGNTLSPLPPMIVARACTGLAGLEPQRLDSGKRSPLSRLVPLAPGDDQARARATRFPSVRSGESNSAASSGRRFPDQAHVSAVRLDGHQRERDPGRVGHQAVGAGLLVQVGRRAAGLVLQVLDARRRAPAP